MPAYGTHFWKKAPFLKLLLPMMAGILIQWQFQMAIRTWWIIFLVCFITLIHFFFIPLFNRYRLSFLSGIVVGLLFISVGALLIWYKDGRHDRNWFGNFYKEKEGLVATLDEPPVEKTNSVKAEASVNLVVQGDKSIPVKGKIILYFKKDTSAQPLSYGSRILFQKPLQRIKNAGNPGGFDYERYCLFKGITYQVYLKSGEFEVWKEKRENWFDHFLFSTREKILTILRNNINDNKERGLAEALLIGYKDDLDKELEQSYANTGVVHIIVIAGLHLGIVYWVLVLFIKPLKKRKKIKWLAPVITISGLWLFALLAGAHAPVVRAAVMLTCVVLAENLGRKTSIYNTLAVSAFILLCYNPFWLWDAGFQLSFAAVASIVTFMRPIYNWVYFKNKALDFIWKINAVSMAAQLFTFPFVIYHFHQFANLFLLTNMMAVPIAILILLGEIFLCFISFIIPMAVMIGSVLSLLIRFMNLYIQRIESLPFSRWAGMQITVLQVLLLIMMVSGFSYWLLEKHKNGTWAGIISLLVFMGLRSLFFYQSNQQKKIIVYNVPKKKAIDLINGRNYFFIGDSGVQFNDFAQTSFLKSSRTLYRVKASGRTNDLFSDENYISFYYTHILLLDKPVSFVHSIDRPRVDLLVISKNPTIYFSKLSLSLDIKEVVFDGSVPAWKTRHWKRDCDSLQIPWYDVNEKGAFVMNIQ